jgi:SAM-dependent methyltransferase
LDFELPSKPEGVSNLEFVRLLTPYVYAGPLASRKVILDVGCSLGHGSLWLAKGANQVVAFDIDKAKIRQLSKWSAYTHLGVSIMDAQRLGFTSRTFQVVTCFEVIEHVPHPDTLLSELRRVLTEEGCLLLTTPNRAVRLLPLQRPWNHEHLREYSLGNLRRSLRKHFPIVKLLGIFGEPEPHAYYRRSWRGASLIALLHHSRLLNIVRSLASASDGARRDQYPYTSLGKSFRSETGLVNMEIPNPSTEEWPFYVDEVSKQCLNFFAICGLNVQTVQQSADIVEHGS